MCANFVYNTKLGDIKEFISFFKLLKEKNMFHFNGLQDFYVNYKGNDRYVMLNFEIV